MAQRSVSATVVNTPLGVTPSADGVMGLVIKGKAVSPSTGVTGLVLGTAYMLSKLGDCDTLGVNAAYDVSAGSPVYQQIAEYYAQAGDGAKLWLYVVDVTTAVMATVVASAAFKTFVRGTATADPLNRVKMIGIGWEYPVAAQSSTDFPTDVTATVTALTAVQVSLLAEGYPLAFVVDGYNMKSTFTSSGLTTLATQSNYCTEVVITGASGKGNASIGNVLGFYARATVGQSAGEVQPSTSYQVNQLTTAYFTNNITTALSTQVSSFTDADFSNLGAKQFMFLRVWRDKSGFFWNDDATSGNSTMALSQMPFQRVANRLVSDALAFFLNQINKRQYIDASTGDVESSILRGLEGQFTTNHIKPLITSGDISDATITVTGTDFATNRALTFVISILPAPGTASASGTIQFVATL
jgi:hypothetical protein